MFEKYSPPLQIHWLVKFILVVSSLFVLFAPILVISDTGSIQINGLEYNIEGVFWLKVVGAICTFSIGVSAITILLNIKHSLVFYGISVLASTASNIIHPAFQVGEFIYSLFITLTLFFYLLYLEGKRSNIKPTDFLKKISFGVYGDK